MINENSFRFWARAGGFARRRVYRLPWAYRPRFTISSGRCSYGDPRERCPFEQPSRGPPHASASFILALAGVVWLMTAILLVLGCVWCLVHPLCYSTSSPRLPSPFSHTHPDSATRSALDCAPAFYTPPLFFILIETRVVSMYACANAFVSVWVCFYFVLFLFPIPTSLLLNQKESKRRKRNGPCIYTFSRDLLECFENMSNFSTVQLFGWKRGMNRDLISCTPTSTSTFISK